jgi:alginate O-acetyltransferase complex protein AlgI
MLFNSYQFVFAFLPVTLIGFYTLGHRSPAWAIRWLILASFVFYAWWRPINVLLISPSILINYGLSRALLRLGDNRPQAARLVLLLGVLFNLTFLGYFKYLNFLEGTINDVFGANLVLTRLILPLGISFITFQKIAFLIDVQAGRVKSFTLRDYCLFVLFFPQLVAGPIVHYREMMPQFHRAPCRFDPENAAVGLSLFFFGLFKKVVFADSIAPLVSPIYASAAQGDQTSLLYAWVAALGFTLQIYFDFSGYSDMALGLARFFGIKLPVNFNSPLRASNIIDFWLRWHVSLTRFLTAYIYNPLVLSLTRRRIAAGKPVMGARSTTPATFATMLMFPTVLTMFVSGLWHGAGYQYVLWGLIHGALLSVNHAWRQVRPRIWPDTRSYTRVMQPVGLALTFFSVVAAMVMFRAQTVGSALVLWKGMLGLNGVTLPQALYAHLGPVSEWAKAIGAVPVWTSGRDLVDAGLWITVLLGVAMLAPNTLQMLARFEPALGVKPRAKDPASGGTTLSWKPNAAWAVGLSVIAAAGILSLGQLSEFLYWQF